MTDVGYKLTHDSGFAPNPFHGFLTLATCKPALRRCRQQGDWVAGFVSLALVREAARVGNVLQRDSLVFLARITDAAAATAGLFRLPPVRGEAAAR